VINLNPRNKFHITENLNLAINAAKAIGLKVLSTSAPNPDPNPDPNPNPNPNPNPHPHPNPHPNPHHSPLTTHHAPRTTPPFTLALTRSSTSAPATSRRGGRT